MYVDFTFESQCYVITNRAVAANPLFQKRYYRKRFLEKIKIYLSPICEVVACNTLGHEFQIIVRLKKRAAFRKHYIASRKKEGKAWDKIPHSSYIFSRCMANLQSGLVKHFNWRENRSGALFASRFKKILIANSVELNKWLEDFKNLKKIHSYSHKWKHSIRGFRRGGRVRRGYATIEEKGGGIINSTNVRRARLDLQGRIQVKLKRLISKQDLLLFLEIKHNIKILI